MGAWFDRDVCDEVAARAARLFGLAGCAVRLLLLSENLAYAVEDPGETRPRAVLRLCRPGYRTRDEVAGEMAWLAALHATTDIPAVQPLAGEGGAFVQRVALPGAPAFLCTLTRFVPGETLDATPRAHDPVVFERVGSLAARLHVQAGAWEGASRVVRPRLTFASMAGPRAVWGPWAAFPGFSTDDVRTLRRCADEVERRLCAYGRAPQTAGLVHADLRAANLVLGRDGTLTALDFDDSGFGWFMQDAAASLSFEEARPDAQALLDAWLEGYRRVRPLGPRDEAMLPTFVMMRRLQLTGWLASRPASDPVPGLARGWAAGTLLVAERYLSACCGGACAP